MASKANSAPQLKGAGDATIAIEQWPVDRLVPYAQNTRSHPPKQVAQIAASIKEFGFNVPVLVDQNNVLIAGHGRVLGAKDLGLKAVPVIRLEHLTDAQVKAFRLADNKIALNADWLDDLLKAELSALKELDFDLSLVGFSDRELQALLTDEAELERAEETPPVPVNPVSIAGDVWLLGKHRLLCGDSTVATDVERVLASVKPHLMVTDPPYGVVYDAGWRNEAMPHKNDPKRWKDGAGRATGAVLNDDRADWSEAYALFPGDVAYVWHPAGARQVEFYNSLLASGFEVRMQIIWAKSHYPIGRGNYHVQHEPCWYAVRKKQGATAHWQGDRKQSTLWQIDKPQKSETGHSTQKPVECMRRPIMNNSSPGQAVYEPFSGSGTTIIAAEMTGRACHAIELNPAYVDVAVKRWEQFTGSQATLEADGRTFQQVSDDRYDADKNSKESYDAGIKALREGKAKAGAETEAGT